ncbi:MAG: helix-turn-helix domain-containing protein [Proteobacteria bacterium]|nr:helix-turn-helix domain-containing protein [Pseudomonadota bacterium]
MDTAVAISPVARSGWTPVPNPQFRRAPASVVPLAFPHPGRCGMPGFGSVQATMVERAGATHINVRKGAALFRAGERSTALYAIRLGSFKTQVVTDDGHEQVSGYHMTGDVIGSDGIGGSAHDCEAVALEDAEVYVLPFERIEALAREDIGFQRSLHRVLAGEIARERGVMVMLGTMRAEQRLASFLIDLARRYHERGYSGSEFVLRMTREEIGSHLGLTLETVSRLFSRFRDSGLIDVRGRVVKLLDRAALKRIILAG